MTSCRTTPCRVRKAGTCDEGMQHRLCHAWWRFKLHGWMAAGRVVAAIEGAPRKEWLQGKGLRPCAQAAMQCFGLTSWHVHSVRGFRKRQQSGGCLAPFATRSTAHALQLYAQELQAARLSSFLGMHEASCSSVSACCPPASAWPEYRRRREGSQGKAQGAVWAVKRHCIPPTSSGIRGVASVSHRPILLLHGAACSSIELGHSYGHQSRRTDTLAKPAGRIRAAAGQHAIGRMTLWHLKFSACAAVHRVPGSCLAMRSASFMCCCMHMPSVSSMQSLVKQCMQPGAAGPEGGNPASQLSPAARFWRPDLCTGSAVLRLPGCLPCHLIRIICSLKPANH